MKYSDLYNYANGLETDAISVKDLARRIASSSGTDIGEVNFWPVELDSNISYGHIKYERDRSSAYGEEFRIANIRYDKTLNRCWTRFVCCKELMHVFDTPEERVDTREKFLKLMKELETLPMKPDISPMLASELNAEWMALIVLCPKKLRDRYKPLMADKTMSELDVALKLKIPEATVRSLMSDYYETALASFTRA